MTTPNANISFRQGEIDSLINPGENLRPKFIKMLQKFTATSSTQRYQEIKAIYNGSEEVKRAFWTAGVWKLCRSGVWRSPRKVSFLKNLGFFYQFCFFSQISEDHGRFPGAQPPPAPKSNTFCCDTRGKIALKRFILALLLQNQPFFAERWPCSAARRYQGTA